MQESKRFFSSEKSQNPNLIRDIPQSGFTDAEGCFNISIFKDNTFKFGWRPQFLTGFTDAEGSFMISIFRNTKSRLG